MTRKPLLRILSVCFIVVLIMSGAPSTSYAQDANPENSSEFPISIELRGEIKSINGKQLTLTDDTVVNITKDTDSSGVLKVGTKVVISAELDDIDLVALSIRIDDGTTVEEPPLEPAEDAVTDDDCAEDADEDAATGDDEEDDEGNGKGKGNGGNKGNKGNNGKGNNGKGKDTKADDCDTTAKGNGKGKGNGGNKGNSGNKNKDDKAKGNGGESEAKCLARTNHPVAERLAATLGVSYTQIIAWHCAGNGYGEIARAYLIVQAAAKVGKTVSVDEILAMRDAKMGWGQILKELGVKPSSLAQGKLKNRGKSKK